MKTQVDYLLIDVNAIGYAAMYQPELQKLSYNGHSTSALYGVCASIFSLMKQYPNAVPLLLWDGHCQWRSEIYSEYKANRDDDEIKRNIRAEYAEQSRVLQNLLSEWGLPFIRHHDIEADDIAGVLCRNLPKTSQIVMATVDSDWVQALDTNVTWLNTRSKQLVNLEVLATEDFKDGPFDSPQQYIQAKCMAGDTSDNISGVRGIGLKTAAKALRDYGSFEALWERVNQGETLKGAKLLSMVTQEAQELYHRNQRIMNWEHSVIPPDLYYTMFAQNKENALAIARSYALRSAEEQLNTFVLPQENWKERLQWVEAALANQEPQMEDEPKPSLPKP